MVGWVDVLEMTGAGRGSREGETVKAKVLKNDPPPDFHMSSVDLLNSCLHRHLSSSAC